VTSGRTFRDAPGHNNTKSFCRGGEEDRVGEKSKKK